MHPTRPILTSSAATIAFLMLAAALTPEQSPILPIEISVVLAALTAWAVLRGSRLSHVVLAVFGLLLTALTVHILAGDLGEKGARELVPDVLILGASVAVAFSSVRGALRPRALV
jgi:hypothetical protein